VDGLPALLLDGLLDECQLQEVARRPYAQFLLELPPRGRQQLLALGDLALPGAAVPHEQVQQLHQPGIAYTTAEDAPIRNKINRRIRSFQIHAYVFLSSEIRHTTRQ
jgi:hypothetical protein